MKQPELDDPMELVGVALPSGDTDAMAEALIEEYLLMGWNPQQVMVFFRSPVYQLTHQIYHDRGQDYVKSRIRAVLERWRQGRVQGGQSDA